MGVMKDNPIQNTCIQLLLERYRTAFRIPENLEYHSEEDYKKAERRYLKYAIEHGAIEIGEVPNNR